MGHMVTYKPTFKKARRLWVSPQFSERHANIVDDILTIYVRKPGSKLKWLCGTLGDYLRARGPLIWGS